MKTFVITLAFLFAGYSAMQAQNLLSKVPSNASAVIKYSGNNFSKNVPLQKVDSYNFIKHNFFKLLHIDTLTSLQSIGISFDQDAYQYVSMEDSSMSFVTLLHLANAPQFLQFIKASFNKPIKTEQKDGFQFLTITDDNYIGWNETVAIMVTTSYQNKRSYYDYSYRNDSVIVAADSAVMVMRQMADSAAVKMMAVDTTSISPLNTQKSKKTTGIKKGAQKRTTATAKNKTTIKKAPVKKKIVEVPPVIMDEEVVVDTPDENYKYAYNDSIENLKRELWQQQQDMIAAKKQQAVAEKIMANVYTGTVNSIENEVSYKKIIDPAAHASVWLNAESLSNQYWNYFYRGAYSFLYNKPRYIKEPGTDGFKSSVNIYFDKDKVRMEQKTFSTDPKMADMAKAVMNSKQSTSLANYVNPGNVGYFSMSINTEAMANYYYTLLKKYISNTPYTNEYADVVDIYIDMLEIIIDEKGIAELMPGNYLFVMHSIKPRIVNYTDYEYDKEFNKTEVQKTKKELSPDFTFILETKKEGFMEKIARLPLKYAEKEKFNYKDKGGYYELAFGEGKFPISSLYFMVKDGKAIVTTSKEVVDITLNNKAFATDAETKRSILNNNYSLKIDAKKLIESLNTEFNTDLSKKIGDYLLENLGDLKMESSIKDGMIQGTTTMAINGNHNNSLEFFFNMIDTINTMIEKDKMEQDKRLN